MCTHKNRGSDFFLTLSAHHNPTIASNLAETKQPRSSPPCDAAFTICAMASTTTHPRRVQYGRHGTGLWQTTYVISPHTNKNTRSTTVLTELSCNTTVAQRRRPPPRQQQHRPCHRRALEAPLCLWAALHRVPAAVYPSPRAAKHHSACRGVCGRHHIRHTPTTTTTTTTVDAVTSHHPVAVPQAQQWRHSVQPPCHQWSRGVAVQPQSSTLL